MANKLDCGVDLRGDEHASGADELKLCALHRHEREKPVDVVDRQEEGLGVKPVLFGDLDQPVDEDGPHREGDVRLLGHVVPLGKVLGLEKGCSSLRPRRTNLI